MQYKFLSLMLNILLICFITPLDHAAQLDVEFGGTLVSEPCQVHTDSQEQLVEFNLVTAKTFINHDRSAPQKFKIMLSECDLSLGESVKVTFAGEQDSVVWPEKKFFALQGSAEGIALEVETLPAPGSPSQPVVPNEPLKPVTLLSGENEMFYQAYITASDYNRVVEGDFTTTVTFDLEYE